MKPSFSFSASPDADRGLVLRLRFLLLATIGIAVLPLAWRGTSCGQDFDFHLQNWLELVRSWHQGVLYPRWAGSANYGAGEPRFVFYPPLARFLGAALGSVLPWSWTPVAFTTLVLLCAGVSLRAMAREWISEESAVFAACLYIVNPYVMFVIYERGAVAELLAAVWIPLLALYGLRRRSSVVPLAITTAALWLTDAPAAVMGMYSLGIFVLVAVLRNKEGRLAGRALAAVPLGLGIAGFWLIPAIWEQRWVQIGRAIGPLMRVEDSFLFGFAKLSSLRSPISSTDQFNLIYHNQVLGLASWICLVLMLATAAAVWFSRACFSREKCKGLWLPLVVLSIVISIIQFHWTDFLWRFMPELRFVQFPWRWMLVLGMTFAILAGMASSVAASFSGMTARAAGIRAGFLLLLACGTSVWASIRYWQPCDEEDNIAAQISTFHGSGFEGTDEYTPGRADNGLVQQGLPVVRLLSAFDAEESAADDNPAWAPASAVELPTQTVLSSWKNQRMFFEVQSPGRAWAVLRLMDYPAWHVTRNGLDISIRPHRSDGLMAIPIAEGRNHIEVRWKDTADQILGFVCSLIALAVTLALAIAARRNSQKVPLP